MKHVADTEHSQAPLGSRHARVETYKSGHWLDGMSRSDLHRKERGDPIRWLDLGRRKERGWIPRGDSLAPNRERTAHFYALRRSSACGRGRKASVPRLVDGTRRSGQTERVTI